MMGLLSYEDQVYLLYYWLRTNIPATAQVASVAKLRRLVTQQLNAEYNVADTEAINDIVALFREQAPWDRLPVED